LERERERASGNWRPEIFCCDYKNMTSNLVPIEGTLSTSPSSLLSDPARRHLIERLLGHFNDCESLPALRTYCASHECPEDIWQEFGVGSELSTRTKIGVSLECYIRNKLRAHKPRNLWIVSSFNPANNQQFIAFAKYLTDDDEHIKEDPLKPHIQEWNAFPNEPNKENLRTHQYGLPLFMRYLHEECMRVPELRDFQLEDLDSEYPTVLFDGYGTPETERFTTLLRSLRMCDQVPTVTEYQGRPNPNCTYGMWKRKDLKPSDFFYKIPQIYWKSTQDIVETEWPPMFSNPNARITLFHWRWT
jgi:hypothetical protein